MKSAAARALVCILLTAAPSAADVWNCGGVYTNNAEGKENCKAIEGSKVCGKEGNKYFAPRRMSGSTEEACVSTGKSKSPFVDVERAKRMEARPAQTKRKFDPPNPPSDTKIGGNDEFDSSGLPQGEEINKALAEIGKALGGE